MKTILVQLKKDTPRRSSDVAPESPAIFWHSTGTKVDPDVMTCPFSLYSFDLRCKFYLLGLQTRQQALDMQSSSHLTSSGTEAAQHLNQRRACVKLLPYDTAKWVVTSFSLGLKSLIDSCCTTTVPNVIFQTKRDSDTTSEQGPNHSDLKEHTYTSFVFYFSIRSSGILKVSER